VGIRPTVGTPLRGVRHYRLKRQAVERAGHAWAGLKKMRSRGIVLQRWIPTQRGAGHLWSFYRVNASSSQVNVTFEALRSAPVVRAPEAANSTAEEHRRSLVQTTVFQSVDHLLAKLPSAAMLVDWDLNRVCWNAAAVDFCTECARAANQAKGRNRTANLSTAVLPLPREVLTTCRSMRSRVDDAMEPIVATVSLVGSHPEEFIWRASIAVVFFEITPHGRPMFLIEVEAADRSDGSTAEAITAIAQLSACEREVALLVADGYSNGEIAQELGKSVMTVKKQLRSIYQKLKVPTRGRLGALIH
jgi:DNA-binding CsgD family transcriptional regulator